MLLLQQEVPPSANAALIARAARPGMRIVLNAAPARRLTRELLAMVDTLIVNETEAAALATMLGWPAEAATFAAAAAAAIDGLEVVVTLGAAGAVSVRGREQIHVAPAPLDVVDTTGAGDAFAGAFAAALDAGDDRACSAADGVAAGSLACTMHGAQPALPARDAIDALLPSVTSRARVSRLLNMWHVFRQESPCATIRCCAVLLFAVAAVRAGATDYTDIWYNPSEQSTAGGGWGVNVVQSDAFLFLDVLHLRARQQADLVRRRLDAGRQRQFQRPVVSRPPARISARRGIPPTQPAARRSARRRSSRPARTRPT